MTTSFPETKEDFTADNGVTYTWDVNRWRTKAYKLNEGEADARLPYTLETDKTLKESRQVKSVGGEIQLVDAEGNFSNVTFTGRGGTLTGSTAAGITIDTTALSTLIAGNQQEIQELNNKYDNINIPEYNEPDLDGYLPLTGGAMTGSMRSKLITCTRNEGYAFEVKPADETLAAIRTDGTAFLKRTKITRDDGTPYLAQSQDDVCTKQYTDQAIAGIKTKAATGTDSNPSLESGELYWNTSLKVLYIGN